MAEASAGLIGIASLIFIVGFSMWIGKMGWEPLRWGQLFFRGWRAGWMTLKKAKEAFFVEWKNQWEEQWRRAGL
ncbi:MAG TPA: hypothetical protein VNX68_19805 [Nitrosopumilaceae archaeon]|jgi:hypothetical protein|nr:hypothetical protein [Nitrosopumilaceae archaeon]